MNLHDRVQRRPPGSSLLCGSAWQLACRLPRRIGLDRTTAPNELAQHRVIHPRSGEKPCPDVAALGRIWAQRPRPYMGGRALRALTGPRFTRHRPRRHIRRCRLDAIAMTPQHTHTVKPTPDNPDLPGVADTKRQTGFGRADIGHKVNVVARRLGGDLWGEMIYVVCKRGAGCSFAGGQYLSGYRLRAEGGHYGDSCPHDWHRGRGAG